MSNNEMFEITKEVVKEISKDVYDDVISPVAKPTGEILGLIPRAIKAALSPLEKWILQKEYNISEIQRLRLQKCDISHTIYRKILYNIINDISQKEHLIC